MPPSRGLDPPPSARIVPVHPPHHPGPLPGRHMPSPLSPGPELPGTSNLLDALFESHTYPCYAPVARCRAAPMVPRPKPPTPTAQPRPLVAAGASPPSLVGLPRFRYTSEPAAPRRRRCDDAAAVPVARRPHDSGQRHLARARGRYAMVVVAAVIAAVRRATTTTAMKRAVVVVRRVVVATAAAASRPCRLPMTAHLTSLARTAVAVTRSVVGAASAAVITSPRAWRRRRERREASDKASARARRGLFCGGAVGLLPRRRS